MQPPRAIKGTPNILKARYLVTRVDPVINVQLVGKLPYLSSLQIKDLLLQGEQNALHIDNAIVYRTAIISI